MDSVAKYFPKKRIIAYELGAVSREKFKDLWTGRIEAELIMITCFFHNGIGLRSVVRRSYNMVYLVTRLCASTAASHFRVLREDLHRNNGIAQLSKLSRPMPLKKYDFIEFRTFNFSPYPSYVRELDQYRWKPLIIAELLTEFDAVWYMDTSIRFEKGDLSHVYALINCRNTVSDRPPIKSIAERDSREKGSFTEDGWDKELWRRNLVECRKPAFLMHSYTGHGIYDATFPEIYEYIPTNMDEIKKKKAKMYESGITLVVKAKDTMEDILKWFDQSALNVLVANIGWYDKHYYASEITDFFVVSREWGTQAEYSP